MVSSKSCSLAHRNFLETNFRQIKTELQKMKLLLYEVNDKFNDQDTEEFWNDLKRFYIVHNQKLSRLQLMSPKDVKKERLKKMISNIQTNYRLAQRMVNKPLNDKMVTNFKEFRACSTIISSPTTVNLSKYRECF